MSPVVVGVTAKSFAKSQKLRLQAQKRFPDHRFRYAIDEPIDVEDSKALKSFLKPCDVWLVGRERVSSELISSLPKLKLITKYGVGIDNIDFDACEHKQIKVHAAKGVNSQEVAEHTIGLMLSIGRNIALSDRNYHSGIWLKDGGLNLSGSTVGVIGFGHVGQKVARLCRAFGCEVLINDIIDFSSSPLVEGLEVTALSELLKRSRFVSLHVPLTDKTRAMIGTDELELIGPQGFLINTSRGMVVDEKCLLDCLRSGALKGAALDVFVDEPNINQELSQLDKFVATAHIAGNSSEAVAKMGAAALDGISTIS